MESMEEFDLSGRAWHCIEAVAQLWGIYFWFSSPLTVDGQEEDLTAILMAAGFTYCVCRPPISLLILTGLAIMGISRCTLSTCGPRLYCWTKTITMSLMVACCLLPYCSGTICLTGERNLELPGQGGKAPTV